MEKVCKNCGSESGLRIANDLTHFLCGACFFDGHKHVFTNIPDDEGFISQCYCGKRET